MSITKETALPSVTPLTIVQAQQARVGNILNSNFGQKSMTPFFGRLQTSAQNLTP